MTITIEQISASKGKITNWNDLPDYFKTFLTALGSNTIVVSAATTTTVKFSTESGDHVITLS